jgi:Kef-type K+ transport system membrane component KefB
MLISWAVTIPASALVAGGLFELTRLPTVLAWVTIGCVLGAFGTWAIVAMAHTIHAADVEAEILSPAELDEAVEPHFQLSGHGPLD